MFKQVTLLFILVFAFYFTDAQDFRTSQKKYERVRTAYTEKEQLLKDLLKEKGINDFNIDIFIQVFKSEKKVEVYVKKKTDISYKFLKEYSICSSSGSLGPKRKQGDYQTPEGFYYIDRFNPGSNFYLSLGINYPNSSDKILGNKNNLGGDIFIHGNCVTVGCIPITDSKIKELYLLAIEAKTNGQQKIPVYIFPFKMTDQKMTDAKNDTNYSTSLIGFWENLKTVYDYFSTKNQLPDIKVESSGKYAIN